MPAVAYLTLVVDPPGLVIENVVVHPFNQQAQLAFVGWEFPTKGSLKRSKMTDGSEAKSAATWDQNVIE